MHPFPFSDLVPARGIAAEHDSLVWGLANPCSALAINLGARLQFLLAQAGCPACRDEEQTLAAGGWMPQ